jgi:hypothetical protein
MSAPGRGPARAHDSCPSPRCGRCWTEQRLTQTAGSCLRAAADQRVVLVVADQAASIDHGYETLSPRPSNSCPSGRRTTREPRSSRQAKPRAGRSASSTTVRGKRTASSGARIHAIASARFTLRAALIRPSVLKHRRGRWHRPVRGTLPPCRAERRDSRRRRDARAARNAGAWSARCRAAESAHERHSGTALPLLRGGASVRRASATSAPARPFREPARRRS